MLVNVSLARAATISTTDTADTSVQAALTPILRPNNAFPAMALAAIASTELRKAARRAPAVFTFTTSHAAALVHQA